MHETARRTCDQVLRERPCHVVGGKAVWDALREKLNLKNGETTPNSRWTLVTTSCLGLCSVGPVSID
ncbi:MAG: NAD(P)H-dependent oxidoreductase subunit E [Anaerolineales bacterium]|nr:NAD(P)H-dependent oxidoreductase subunit E [Anaerolineales bacterium]